MIQCFLCTSGGWKAFKKKKISEIGLKCRNFVSP